MTAALKRLACAAALIALSACAALPPETEAPMPEPMAEAEGQTELALLCAPPVTGPATGPDDGIGGTGCPAL